MKLKLQDLVASSLLPNARAAAGDGSLDPLDGRTCADCARGGEPSLLDKDGVLTSISKNEGTWCHAYDIYWWPCPDKEGSSIARVSDGANKNQSL